MPTKTKKNQSDSSKRVQNSYRYTQCAETVHLDNYPLIFCRQCASACHELCIESYPCSASWICETCKEDPACQICRRKDDESNMLLCDLCDAGYHLSCIDLNSIPSGDWFCSDCRTQSDTTKRNISNSCSFQNMANEDHGEDYTVQSCYEKLESLISVIHFDEFSEIDQIRNRILDYLKNIVYFITTSATSCEFADKTFFDLLQLRFLNQPTQQQASCFTPTDFIEKTTALVIQLFPEIDAKVLAQIQKRACDDISSKKQSRQDSFTRPDLDQHPNIQGTLSECDKLYEGDCAELRTQQQQKSAIMQLNQVGHNSQVRYSFSIHDNETQQVKRGNVVSENTLEQLPAASPVSPGHNISIETLQQVQYSYREKLPGFSNWTFIADDIFLGKESVAFHGIRYKKYLKKKCRVYYSIHNDNTTLNIHAVGFYGCTDAQKQEIRTWWRKVLPEVQNKENLVSREVFKVLKICCAELQF